MLRYVPAAPPRIFVAYRRAYSPQRRAHAPQRRAHFIMAPLCIEALRRTAAVSTLHAARAYNPTTPSAKSLLFTSLERAIDYKSDKTVNSSRHIAHRTLHVHSRFLQGHRRHAALYLAASSSNKIRAPRFVPWSRLPDLRLGLQGGGAGRV